MMDPDLLPILEHMEVNNGDIVIVTLPDNTAEEEKAELVQTLVMFFSAHDKAPMVVLLGPSGSISKLDEDAMRANGWVRA